MIKSSILLLLINVKLLPISAQYFARDGDIIVGVVLPIHEENPEEPRQLSPGSSESPSQILLNQTCKGALVPTRAFLVTQLRKIIDEINANASILGGLKLGYQIFDSCSTPSVATTQAAKWMATKLEAESFNYSMVVANRRQLRPVPFVLGAYLSRVTGPLAQMLQTVDIPLIDFGSTTPALSDRTTYPLFARTTPSDVYQASAIRSIMFSYLMWNCSHIVYSEGIYGETGAEALKNEFAKSGICQASYIKASSAFKGDTNAVAEMTANLNAIAAKAPTSSAIVCFCEENTLSNLLLALRDFNARQNALPRGSRRQRFVIVASDAWGISLPLNDVQSAANGAITLKAASKDIPDWTQWVSSNFQTLIDPAIIDPWMEEFTQIKFGLSHAELQQQRSSLVLPPKDVPRDDYLQLMTTAIRVGVHALKLLLEKYCPSGSGNLASRCGDQYLQHVYKGREFYNSLEPASVQLFNELKFKFMENLDGQAVYDYYYYRSRDNSYQNIGYWDLANRGVSLYRDPSYIMRWSDNGQLIPGTCPLPVSDTSTTLSVFSPSPSGGSCPAIYYYPNRDSIVDNASLSISCAYYCRENQLKSLCQDGPTVLVTTSSDQLLTTPKNTSQTTITALAVILAVCACAFVACLAFLIYSICRCRRYKEQVKDLQRIQGLKLSAPSDINSDKSFNPYRVMNRMPGPNSGNAAYAAMFPGSTTSSLTYAKRGFTELQPIGSDKPLQDELYLAPSSKTSSQASQSERISRIIKSLGGNEEFVKLVNVKWVPNDQLIWGEAFADGKFAFVYHGTLKRPMPLEETDPSSSSASQELPVAVKVLKSRDSDDLLDFLKEAYLMQAFTHPNVMELLGVSLLFDQPHIIVPYMTNGCLRDFVRQYHSNLTEERRLNFCQQIALGMEYLSRNKFIHRDLAARNVLVDSEGLLKIADFGMSRHLQQSDYYKPVTMDRPLPIRWHPPESLQMRVFDERSDVWSFGVVMWEIFSGGMQPYGGLTNNEVVEHVAAGNRLQKPDRCSDDIYEIMLKCWKTAISERPTFAQILEFLATVAARMGDDGPSGRSNLAYAGSNV